MLPRHLRLCREKDIARVRRTRPIYKGELTSIRVHDRDDTHPSRFAVVVGKRVSRKAVDRNRVARLIRAILTEYISSVGNGMDVLIVAHRTANRYDFNTCKMELVNNLQRVGVL